MNRKELIDMVEKGTSFVRTFLVERDSSTMANSTYENWNDNDAVGHIIGWMNYSIDKLSSIKQGTRQSDEYSSLTSLNEINMFLYDKYHREESEEIESKYISALGNYITVISLYSNNEINLDSFDTGFTMDLWRYMLMDTVIHPLQHIFYQYLKNHQMKKITDVLMGTREIFYRYSEENEGYNLSEFEREGPEIQNTLMELRNEFGSDESVNRFVQINMSRKG